MIMALSTSRLRLWLLWGIGLTFLVVLLFQFRYYVTQVIFHPRDYHGSTEVASIDSRVLMNKHTRDRLNTAPPELKDRLSEKGYVGRTKKRTRKKGRSSVKPVNIQDRTSAAHERKELLQSKPMTKVGSSQTFTKVTPGQNHINWIKKVNEQSSEKGDKLFKGRVTSDGEEQEPKESNSIMEECPPATVTVLDTRQLEACGEWIRTCHRKCLCEESEPIPRVVHFIKDEKLTFSDWLAVVAAKKYIKPTTINLFTRDDVSPNCWMRRLHLIDGVNVIRLTAVQWLEKLNNVTVSYVEHQSDLLRNAILYHYGGIYMDTDAIATKSFDSLLKNHSIVLGLNLVNKTGNGLIVARRQSCLICDYASSACDTFDGSWTKHSTVSLSKLVMTNGTMYNLLLLSNTSGFFPFSWKKKHFHQLFDVNLTQVSFSTTQVYALHLFGSKFPEEIVNRFNNLTWINDSPSILASHMRTLVHSQLLKPNHLNETVCMDLPPNLFK